METGCHDDPPLGCCWEEEEGIVNDEVDAFFMIAYVLCDCNGEWVRVTVSIVLVGDYLFMAASVSVTFEKIKLKASSLYDSEQCDRSQRAVGPQFQSRIRISILFGIILSYVHTLRDTYRTYSTEVIPFVRLFFASWLPISYLSVVVILTKIKLILHLQQQECHLVHHHSVFVLVERTTRSFSLCSLVDSSSGSYWSSSGLLSHLSLLLRYVPSWGSSGSPAQVSPSSVSSTGPGWWGSHHTQSSLFLGFIKLGGRDTPHRSS